MKAKYIIPLLAVLGVGGWYAYSNGYLNSLLPSNLEMTTSRVSSASTDAVYVNRVSDITSSQNSSGRTIRYLGVVEAMDMMNVSKNGDSKVAECYVKVGDTVTKGQKLFRYDTSGYETELKNLELDKQELEHDLEGIERDIETTEKAIPKAESKDEKDALEATLKTSQNSLKQKNYEIAKKQLEIEEKQVSINNAIVTATMDGIVLEISDEGENVWSYSDTNSYMKIIKSGDYQIRCNVNEMNIDTINVGSNMIVKTRKNTDNYWAGIVSEINTDAAGSYSPSGGMDYFDFYDTDASSSSKKSLTETSWYEFIITMVDGSDGLMLGQHVYVEMDAGQMNMDGQLWINDSYVKVEGDDYYVWLADEKNNTLSKHKITVSGHNIDMGTVCVEDGLSEDDYIAVVNDSLADGLPVIWYSNTKTADEEYTPWIPGLDDTADDLNEYEESSEEYFDDDSDEYYSDDDSWEDTSEYYEDDYSEEYYDEENDYYYDGDEYYIDYEKMWKESLITGRVHRMIE